MWDVVLASTVTPNGFDIVACTGVPTLALVLRVDGVAYVKQFGAKGDGTTDDTAAIQAAINTKADVVMDTQDTYLVNGTLTIPNSQSHYGQSIYGNKATIIKNHSVVGQRTLDVEGYSNGLFDITFSNDGDDNTGIALWLFNRRCRVSGLQFTGGWQVCLDASQTKEGWIENLHIENRAGVDDLTPTGIGIALAHCLNIQITNSYIGWCATNIAPGADVGGVAHGNEGIVIANNTIIKAGNEQINISGLWIDIHNNVIDLCGGDTGAALLLKGQSIKVTSNWIADNSQDTSDKRLVHFYDDSYQATIKNNTFWRGLQEGGVETLKALDMGTSCIACEISGNLFAGRMESLPIPLGGNVTITNNIYDDGAIPITTTGTKSRFQRIESHTHWYSPQGLRISNDSDAIFGAKLGVLGDTGVYAAHFTNNVGTTMFRTGDGGSALNLGFNTSHAAAYFGSGNPTGRSINAAGTVNASGADYAEYMMKRDDCSELSKGDVCGIDANGKLTDKFSLSVKFAVKSTNPSIVGGDDWFTDIEPVMPEEADYESSAEFESAVEKYESDMVVYASEMEAARSRVDRIAFCGQVPVNASFSAGDFLIPVAGENDSITIKATSQPTFDEFIVKIGQAISDDLVIVNM
jgi:hypothetical protein